MGEGAPSLPPHQSLPPLFPSVWGNGEGGKPRKPHTRREGGKKEVKELGMASSSFLSLSLLFIPPAALLCPFRGGFFAWLKRGRRKRKESCWLWGDFPLCGWDN